jgi:hypothetical protein
MMSFFKISQKVIHNHHPLEEQACALAKLSIMIVCAKKKLIISSSTSSNSSPAAVFNNNIYSRAS